MKSSSPLFPTLVTSSVLALLMVAMLLLGIQRHSMPHSPPSMFVLVHASNHPPPTATSTPPSPSSEKKKASKGSTTSCEKEDAATKTEGSCQIINERRQRGGGIARVVFDWGLAKLENIMRNHDGILISDLISAFLAKCDRLFAILIHSIKDMFVSYATLHQREVERLSQFDVEFKDLVKLRHKIERRCLYSNNLSPEDQSLCVDRGVEIRDKIQKLRRQRTKSAELIKRYEDMQRWCASYDNWFC